MKFIQLEAFIQLCFIIFVLNSNRNLYETSKLSNFFTLIIMAFIVLAVYKSCNKSRENELMRRELGSYAHIVEPSDSNFNMEHSNLYPPPPPPYGFVVNPPTSNPNGASGNPGGTEEYTNTNGQSHQSDIPSATVFKPDLTQPDASATNTTENSNSQSNSSTSPPNVTTESSRNTWGNLLTGAAVAGYLLSIRR